MTSAPPPTSGVHGSAELRELFEGAQRVGQCGAFIWDVRSDETEWSEHFLELLGRTPDAVEHTFEGFLACVHPDDVAFVREAGAMVVATGLHPEVPYRVVRPDGTVRECVSIGRVERDERGEPARVFGFMQDVTERRRSERERERQVRAESIGQLAAGIAHDFNNYLAAIAMNLYLAESCEDRGEVAQCLGEARAAVDAAQGLTRQLLTFSLGGSPVRANVDLVALARGCIEFALRGSGVELQLEASERSLVADVDPGQLQQVLSNLTLNAAQAMGSTGTLRVRIAREAEKEEALASGPFVRIDVEDVGPGIPDEARARIFEPYYTTKPTGTGLGLPTSKSIVEKHRGAIEVGRGAHGGSVFSLWLPIGERRPADEADAPSAGSLHGVRMLVMDDDAAVLRILVRSLGRLGCEVSSARDGDELLALFDAARAEGKPFDVVLADVTVPGGRGGLECLPHLRESSPHVPVIMMTGYSNDEVSTGGPRADAVLAKPFPVDEVVRAFARARVSGR